MQGQIALSVSAREGRVKIPDKLLFRIGDVAGLVGVKSYVLRYWEKEFPVLSPHKSHSGQRVYKRSDVETLLLIKHLLYTERYSIEGARKRLMELRRKGEISDYKAQKVLATETRSVEPETKKKALKLLLEIQDLARAPVREVFKY